MLKRLPLPVAFTVVVILAVGPVTATQYAFRTYTPEQGLAATAVFSIDQDEAGYLWFATSEGVSRFDGTEFRKFDVSTGLPDQRVYSMLRDTSGSFWFGHSDGVSLFDGRTLRNFSHEDGVARGVTWAGTLDRFGHPWFGTQNGGVSVWTGSAFKSYGVESGLPEEFVYGLMADSQNRLWIGMRYRGIAVAKIDDEGGFEIIRTFSSEFLGARGVRDFREDSGGNIYAATRGNGVIRFDGETLEPNAKLLEGTDTYALLVTRENELIVGRALGGIEIYSLPDLRLRLELTENEGLPSEIFSLFEDREGGIWIGTGAGIVRWPGEAITNYDRRDGIVGTSVLGVSAEGESSVWVGSAQGVSLLAVSPEFPGRFTVRNITRKEGLPSDEVWQALRDSAGRLWFATAEGLCLYTEGRGCRTWTAADGLPSDYVGVLVERAEGGLWVGAAGGVVALELDASGRPGGITPIGSNPTLEAANVYAIVEVDDGRLWIATDAGLVTWMDGEFSTLGPQNGLPRRGINDLLVDGRGDLWVATSGMGLARAAAGTWTGPDTEFSTFGVEAGLPSNTVMSLVEGDDDTIWAGTGAGVAQVDASLVRDSAMNVVRNQLTSASGLLGSEPGSGGAFCRTPDGVFWFGLARGVSRYDTALVRGVDVRPTVEIGRVIANTRTVYVAPFDTMMPDGVIALAKPDAVLTHKANDIAFEYHGISFHDPSRVSYQTILEGMDEDWSAPTRARVKEYTHLPPGDYVFRVRAFSASGLMSDSNASYEVTIRPPFWATDWFPMVLLVVLALLISAIVQLRSFAIKRHNIDLAEVVAVRTADLEIRTRELEIANSRVIEGEMAKSRFLAGMSHELRTPLNSIIGFTELMLGREEGRDSRAAKFLGNVHHSAHQLLALINDLLDLSKIEAGKMEVFVDRLALPPLVETVLSTLEPLSTPRRVTVETDVPEGLPVLQLDASKVWQILYNLLSNAIKFSPPGSTIRIAVRDLDPGSTPLATESVLIEIEDRGIGIPLDEIQTIFDEYHQSPTVSKLGLGTGLGLSIVKKFAELQGGTVQVEPNDEGGSTFRVWLPQNALEYETDSGPHKVFLE